MREVEGNRRELPNCPCYRGAQTFHQIKGNSNPLQMLEGKYVLFIFSLNKNIIRGDASLWVGGARFMKNLLVTEQQHSLTTPEKLSPPQ